MLRIFLLVLSYSIFLSHCVIIFNLYLVIVFSAAYWIIVDYLWLKAEGLF